METFNVEFEEEKFLKASYPYLRNLLGWTLPLACNWNPAGQSTYICSRSMMETQEQCVKLE